ncbi:MAG: LysM domain/BON superfamily protein [Planctomycetaceae bacterium]|nr:LysM domain/BON superfamily protein [Planctomycetaceae bacterium]
MQRDLKIGISLCVLMFGVVGAFMFRREQPALKAQGLQLKTARQLDQKIAQRARTPYMTGDIEADEEPGKSVQDPPDGTRPAHLQPPLHLTEEDDGVLAPSRGLGSNLGKSPVGRDAIPHRSRIGGESAPRIVTESVTSGPQTHTIQAGDTLSSLAEKYLGSQKRYQEIFDANRNVLTSPNRLPEGVVIAIPPAASSHASNPSAGKEPRRNSEPALGGNRVTHETRRPGQDVQGQDLTDFPPIAPDAGTAKSGPEQGQPNSSTAQVTPGSDHSEASAVDGKLPDSKPVDSKSGEPTKKRLFAPGRLPFGNNTSPRVSPQRKPVVPESDVTPESKEIRGVDPAHEDSKHAYQVRKGDSLERISQRVYGNPKRAADIFNANRDKLARPDAVKEGLELALP